MKKELEPYFSGGRFVTEAVRVRLARKKRASVLEKRPMAKGKRVPTTGGKKAQDRGFGGREETSVASPRKIALYLPRR